MPKDPDVNVSNGTCYMAAGTKSGGAMIPCGNDYFGHVACCQAGDKCLESNVCFNDAYGVTYIAGCTDDKYEDLTCPWKYDDTSTPWMGMAYCNGTSDDWVICDQKEHPKAITSPDACSCPTAVSSRTMHLQQDATIPNTAMLPISLGGKISFFPGYSPAGRSATGDPTASSGSSDLISGSLASSTSSSSTILTPTPTLTTESTSLPTAANISAAQPKKQGFNEAAKIGTAVGATIAGLLALAALGFFALRRIRQKRARQQEKQQREEEEAISAFMRGGNDKTSQPGDNFVNPRDIGIAVSGPDQGVSRLSNPDTPAVSELESIAARPWSTRSELDSIGTATVRSPSTLSMMTAGQDQAQAQGHEHVRAGPSELASQPLAELPG